MATEERTEKGRCEMSYNPNAIEPPYEETYECPKCGSEISPGTLLYLDEYNDVLGCEECIHTRFAEDYFEEGI